MALRNGDETGVLIVEDQPVKNDVSDMLPFVQPWPTIGEDNVMSLIRRFLCYKCCFQI